MKPIPFPRFLKAINRAKEMHLLSSLKTEENLVSAFGEKEKEDEFIFVKSEYENIKIKLESIKYIQGLKDYLKIHVETNKPILTLMNFRDIQSKLPESHFLRIHRSFVVNINRIHSVQKSKVIIDDVRIPIGESYKNEFLKRIGL